MRAAREISDQLYGDAPGTWAMDMNQFLVKAPCTLTDTPWHQDQSYYVELADPRACNLWLALVDVTVDMGCLWFVDAPLDAPGPLRPHRQAGRGGGALEAEGFSEAAATAVPLRAGSITVHGHMTPHYARGNATAVSRQGYVMQTRPSWSVREARMLGFDHGRCAGEGGNALCCLCYVRRQGMALIASPNPCVHAPRRNHSLPAPTNLPP
jgi:phytanoyl-CoA hydroxylase